MIRIALLILCAFSAPCAHAQVTPTPQDVERRMQELRATLPGIVDRAQQESGAAKRRVDPSPRQYAPPTKAVVDPAVVAEQFRQMLDPRNPADRASPVMVFVSLSMPSETLRRLARESYISGVPLLLRGLRYGVGQDNIRRGLEAIRPYSELGATILIHPEAFDTYGVASVPTFVVDPDASAGCADGQCLARARRVVGEVTLQFAMDEVSQMSGEAARLAWSTASELRRRSQ